MENETVFYCCFYQVLERLVQLSSLYCFVNNFKIYLKKLPTDVKNVLI